MVYVLSLIAAVVLTSPFGAVEGKAVDDSVGLTVEVTIDVDRTFEAVLVRPFSSFEELPPTALVQLDSDSWRGLVALPTAADWSLVFDGHEAGGEAFRSDAVTLTEIGVDPVLIDGEPVPPSARGWDRSTWWLFAAIVLALTALGALGWWAFAAEDEDQASESAEESEPGSRPDQ